MQLSVTNLPPFIIKPFYFDAPFWTREMDKMLNFTSELNEKEIVIVPAKEKKFWIGFIIGNKAREMERQIGWSSPLITGTVPGNEGPQ